MRKAMHVLCSLLTVLLLSGGLTALTEADDARIIAEAVEAQVDEVEATLCAEVEIDLAVGNPAAPEEAEEVRASIAAEQEIAIDEVNFPDGNFRRMVSDFDTDGDGTLSQAERDDVKQIDASQSIYEYGREKTVISTLQGIGFFTNLEELDCSRQGFSSLDVSMFPKLTTLECGQNKLKALNLSHNPALTNLSCYGLAALDLSHNPALKTLECGGETLTSLSLSNNPALERLDCTWSGLSRLDLRACSSLNHLNLEYNGKLDSLDLSACKALSYVVLRNNAVTGALDVSNCPELTDLYVQENNLTTLNARGCAKLKTLYCYNNRLTALDVTGCAEMRWLHCYGNRLTSLDVSDCGYVKRGIEAGPAASQTLNGVKVDKYTAFFENWDQNVLIVDSAVKLTTAAATPEPTAAPTAKPTAAPTAKPTAAPTAKPTAAPTEKPTAAPESTATPASVKTSIKKAKITVKDQAYTGKALTPAVTVKLNGAKLKKGTDYTVEYSGNKKVGTATVKVTGKGQYNGSAKATFKINPKAVTGLTLKAGKGKLAVSWKKVSGVTGYQVQYGLKKNFTDAKALTVKKAATVKKALKGLKSNKTYYVRIRAYNAVNGVKYWSAWSKAVKKKTK